MNFFFYPRVPGFTSRLSLLNVSAMERHDSEASAQVLYMTWSDGRQWHHRRLRDMAVREHAIVSEQDVSLHAPADAHVFLYLYPGEVPEATGAQVTSEAMSGLSNWRANIQIRSDAAYSSYQGEFPGEMLDIPKGSFVSVNPMHQPGVGLRNGIVFVNMRRSPAIERAPFVVADMKSRKVLLETEVRSNAANWIDISEVPAAHDSPLVAACPALAGVPVYLTYTDDRNEISFEHTHPPVSSLIFGNALAFQRGMKGWWLTRLFGEKTGASS